MELDEVEIQKGFSQIAQALHFLHDSVKALHCNLTPDSIIINAKGDWKLSSFGLSIPLFDEGGAPARWIFPELDRLIPMSLQRDYDYIGKSSLS
jgi:SCY1-like protein 2